MSIMTSVDQFCFSSRERLKSAALETWSSSSARQRTWPENTSKSTAQNTTGTWPWARACWRAPTTEQRSALEDVKRVGNVETAPYYMPLTLLSQPPPQPDLGSAGWFLQLGLWIDQMDSPGERPNHKLQAYSVLWEGACVGVPVLVHLPTHQLLSLVVPVPQLLWVSFCYFLY